MDDTPQTDSDEPTNDHTDGPSKPEREGKAIRAIEGDHEEHKDELQSMRFSVNRLHDERRTELIPEFWPSNMTPAQSRLWAAMEEFTRFEDGALVIGDRKAHFLDLPLGDDRETPEEITGLELHEALRAGFEKAARLAREYREAMSPLFDLAAELAEDTLQTFRAVFEATNEVSPPDEDETPHAANEGPSRDEDAEDTEPGPFTAAADATVFPKDTTTIGGEEIPTERLAGMDITVENNTDEPREGTRLLKDSVSLEFTTDGPPHEFHEVGVLPSDEARDLLTRRLTGEVSRDDALDALSYAHATREEALDTSHGFYTGDLPGPDEVESLDDLRDRLREGRHE